MRSLLIVAGASALSSGCVLGFDELTLGPGGGGAGGETTSMSTSSTGTGGESGSGGASAGGGTTATAMETCSGVCAMPVTGWSGPFVLRSGTVCSAGEDEATKTQLGTQASASGTCTCTNDSGTTCTAPLIKYIDQPCAAGSSNTVASAAPGLTCTAINGATLAKAAVAGQSMFVPSASCSPVGAAPPPVYSGPSVGCSPAAPAACNGAGTCLTNVAPGEACVAAAAATNPDCSSAGAYSVAKSLVSATTSCDCGFATFDCAGVTKVGTQMPGCEVNAITLAEGACGDIASPKGAIFVPDDPASFDGVCSAPLTSVSTTQVTVCCLP
jgi:hypothetical protein